MSDNEEQNEAAYTMLRKYEKPFRLGRYSGVMRGDLGAKSINVNCFEEAVTVWQLVHQDRWVKDFTGTERAELKKGDVLVLRAGMTKNGWPDLEWNLKVLEPGKRVWVWIWEEDRELARRLKARGYEKFLLQVSSASEYRALYRKPGNMMLDCVPMAERVGLVRLNLSSPRRMDVAPLAEALQRVIPGYSEHYSSYNKRHSWSAVALRGFGGLQHLIEKPAEMSKAWKLEHADRMGWDCTDTPVRALLPEIEPLLEQLGGPPFQRIRLMKLSKGKGELARHADITDKESGTMDGKIMRLHIPIVTNPLVEFTCWDYDGLQCVDHFGAGEAFYLDTRKAHKAVNNGDEDRIHLVVDAVANNRRRCLISQTVCL